jgi:hypothetical protein
MSNGNGANECQYLADELASLRELREQLRASLETETDPGMIYAINSEIIRVNKEIRGVQGAYGRCMARGQPGPFLATFAGTYTITIGHPSAPPPYVGPLSLGLVFTVGRLYVAIPAFPAIPQASQVLGLSATTTVTMIGTAAGPFVPRRADPSYGSMTISIELRFDTDVGSDGSIEDTTTAKFLLSTSPSASGLGPVAGSRLDQAGQGQVTIGGATRLMGGLINGTECVLVISGTIAPDPSLP